MHTMDSDESADENLASLKNSIQQSEASIRQMKQTIQVLDARLRHSQSDNHREPLFTNDNFLR